MKTIKLGDTVRDRVTGFKGQVLAQLEALYEASQSRVHDAELQSDGNLRGGVWLENGRLEIVDSPREKLVGFVEVKGQAHK